MIFRYSQSLSSVPLKLINHFISCATCIQAKKMLPFHWNVSGLAYILQSLSCWTMQDWSHPYEECRLNAFVISLERLAEAAGVKNNKDDYMCCNWHERKFSMYFGRVSRSNAQGKISLHGMINWKGENGKPRRRRERDFENALDKQFTKADWLALENVSVRRSKIQRPIR